MQKMVSPLTREIVPIFFLRRQGFLGPDGLMEKYLKPLLAMLGLSHVRTKFLTHVFVLFLSMRGRLNFANMARYGTYSEKSYRTHFEESFPFFMFNLHLIQQVSSASRLIVADCTFLPKSGKTTPHIGKFWNGCVGKAMPGLELSTVAVVDIEKHTAFHLESLLTPGAHQDEESRIDFYVKQITDRATELKGLADYLVYDGAAGKKKFVDGIVDHTELHLISKLRKDADLRYLYTGPRRSGPGRPKEYDGKINCTQLDLSRVERCYEDDEITIFTAVVNSKRFKRNIRIAYIQHRATKGHTILFSTDLTLDGYLIYYYYHLRFQVEFLFRDSKQHTGLTHCQARSEQKLSFHHNASLTAVSLAKADFYAANQNAGQPFSMLDITTSYFNQLYVNRIFDKLGLEPTSDTLAPLYQELLNFGKVAA